MGATEQNDTPAVIAAPDTKDRDEIASEYFDEFLADCRSGETWHVLADKDDSNKFHAYRYLMSIKRMVE
jgi:hypothetical protein